ncbi:MAG TPA: HAD hydrolase-like protein, partial [Rhodanobacter sp.]
MKSLPENIQGVLFDLDGTLLDSAPDLYAALVAQCVEEGVPPPPYAPVREVVSRGSRAVLRCAFAARGEPALEELVPRYLELYQHVMAQQTHTFEGVDDLLARIEA